VVAFFLKTRFFAGNKVIFVKILPKVNVQVLKIDGKFRFPYPGTDSNYLMHDPELYRKGYR
jgi:hypothetical protein